MPTTLVLGSDAFFRFSKKSTRMKFCALLRCSQSKVVGDLGRPSSLRMLGSV